MQVHELKPNHKSKNRKRVGRGGKRGTYSGKGIKGQASRAGRKMVPIIREFIKRYPKLKGYRSFVLSNDKAIVSLGDLEKKFENGELLNPSVLVAKGIIATIKGKMPQVKILANGAVTKKLIIENCQVSKSAKEAIEKAGGSIKS